VLRRHFVLFAAPVAVPVGAASPWTDAQAVWKFGASDRGPKLTAEGEGVRVEGQTAWFGGKGWLALRSGEAPLAEAGDTSIYMRLRAEKPGGILHSSLISLVLHESGIVVAILGVEDAQGRMYREIPLSRFSLERWHDVVVRLGGGALDFVVDGRVMNSVKLAEKPAVLAPEPLLLGAWRVENVRLPEFPDEIVEFLFQRAFSGALDHVAIWKRRLSDAEVAELSGVPALEMAAESTDADRTLAAYRDFHSASRARDVAAVQLLGLAMRQFMARDRRRPIYHLTAPMDAILDPAGAFYHKGKYHVFSYRNMVSLLAFTPLAHFVSDDLVHWSDLPISVWPDSDVDLYGIWLGNLFYGAAGLPQMMYTGLGRQGKFGILASGSDDLLSFSGKTAVLTNMVHHDGHTWKEGETWYTITTRQHWGRREGDLGDAIILLTSPDLKQWTERGEIFAARKHPAPRSHQQRRGFTEYPYLLRFGEKHVMMLGNRPALYWVGRFDARVPVFIPDEPEGKLLDYLNPFHCFNPLTVDDKGPGGSPRRVIQAMQLYASGQVDGIRWYGVHVLPRVLKLEGDRLRQEPVPEAESLRGRRFYKGPLVIPDGATGLLPELRGDALEIVAEFEQGSAKRFGLRVRASSGRAGTKIFVDAAKGEFGAEGGLKIPSPYPELGQGPAYLTPGKPVRVRVFLDRSLLEVFVNGQTGSGVFDADVDAVGVDVFSEGGEARLISLEAWEMRSAWPGVR
jgi:sucrose-6-phosphate hydrolase SacC (GH32 family)